MDLDVFHLFEWEAILFEGTLFEVNRVVVLTLLAGAMCLAFFMVGAARAGTKPRGIGFMAETSYMFVRNNIAIDVIGPEGARYANFLASMFFFVFFGNLLEILPGINFPVNSRMALPALLAVVSLVTFVSVGLKHHGFGYIKETLFPPGVPKLVYVILTPIEFFSVFLIRPLTLAIRLFANMMAGHVLLSVFFLFTADLIVESVVAAPLGILTFLVACILIIFEFMIITIQAYIFTTLTAFYIAEALHGHGEEDHTIDTDHIPGEKGLIEDETQLKTAAA